MNFNIIFDKKDDSVMVYKNDKYILMKIKDIVYNSLNFYLKNIFLIMEL